MSNTAPKSPLTEKLLEIDLQAQKAAVTAVKDPDPAGQKLELFRTDYLINAGAGPLFTEWAAEIRTIDSSPETGGLVDQALRVWRMRDSANAIGTVRAIKEQLERPEVVMVPEIAPASPPPVAEKPLGIIRRIFAKGALVKLDEALDAMQAEFNARHGKLLGVVGNFDKYLADTQRAFEIGPTPELALQLVEARALQPFVGGVLTAFAYQEQERRLEALTKMSPQFFAAAREIEGGLKKRRKEIEAEDARWVEDFGPSQRFAAFLTEIDNRLSEVDQARRLMDRGQFNEARGYLEKAAK